MLRTTALLLLASCAWAQTDPFASVARKTFADLVKLPLDYPAVEVSVHGTRVEEGLRIEDVSWESLDGERPPAFVVRPDGASGRLPAVICLHGSSGSREAMVTKQFGPGEWVRYGRDKPHTRMLGWARELARRGYVALALTQRGLDRRGPPINVQSNVLLTQDRTGMGAVLHEVRQAVTYLSRRDDVDPERIAATGMSFGGITSFYTWVLDDRLAAAAPLCGGVGSVDVFGRKGRISYHGTYWWIPGMLAKGDQADFAAAIAPKPLMIWAPTEDVGMPKEGVDRFAAKVRPAYERAAKPSSFVVHQPAGGHAFTREAFEAMVQFFEKHL
jgi:dienelactone hydrolase